MNNYQKYKLIIVICISILALIILHNYTSNGRYTVKVDPLIILDTKTGTIYMPQNRKYLQLDDFTEMEETDTNR